MIVTCSKEQGIGIVEVSHALTAATVDSFREQLSKWQEAEDDVLNYVIDLKHVDFMDSAGLGTMIAMLKRISEKGGDMKIACLQKKPRMVFEITRAYKVFEIFDTVEEALKAFE
ncbi:STAS domain-containing protein [Pontiella sulfatireligans]|uniref:Anti-sigma factor antagonist n=1 Tax=Pontiella sulfatireligans TaxID=2750658 RepID=A0A6C2USI1_9BACT|nr:STAS domain-containing protein [Pontiella sulfatireligans]VGO22913.1 Anti-sigma-B factor antagonist [Pontiella sulfatireligans]